MDINSIQPEVNTRNKLDVEQKFAKALLDLRQLRPFYSAIYETLERIETTDKDDVCNNTMAVSTRHMIYNKDFVDKLDYNEFLFVNLHEIGHVALMHVSRRGNKDKRLWNIACDLYINKLLADEFDIKPGTYDQTRKVKMPENCLWCSSIDIDVECADSIYEEFDKQAKENGYYDDVTILTSEEREITSKEREITSKVYKFTYQGTDMDNPKYKPVYGEKDNRIFEYDLNVLYVPNDMIEDESDDTKRENDNKRTLSEAVTRHEMASKQAGSAYGLLQMKVTNILKSHIDWRRWLSKYCIKAKSTDTSFANADKRMFYQNAIYPGYAMDESNTIKNVKICIDTSGSISDDDLKYIFGQVLRLSKQYNIEAEVIAWDTVAHSCGKLSSNISISGLDLTGGGGTDPSCIFEYFDSKKCKTKPLVTLVFTDGYWNMEENSKWKSKYKDTLWVLTKDATKVFTPPFGLKTKVKYDN